MTRLQRFLLGFLPQDRRAEAEAESRRWKVICAACGHSASIWDMGGVRYGATGRSLTWGRCKACGKRGKHRVEKHETL